MQISNIPTLSTNSVSSLTPHLKATAEQKGTSSLGDTFENVLSSLNESQQNTDSLLTQLSSGEDVDLHTLMISAEENDVNFRIAMAIRDKLVDSYREVMRMNV